MLNFLKIKHFKLSYKNLKFIIKFANINLIIHLDKNLKFKKIKFYKNI